MRPFILFLLLLVMACRVSAQQKEYLLPVKEGGKWGYINLKGELIIPPRFDLAESFENRFFAKVLINSQLGIIGRDGEVLFKPEGQDFHFLTDSVIAVMKNGRWGIRTIDGKQLLPEDFRDVRFIQAKGLFIFRTDSFTSGVCNKEGKTLVPAVFDSIRLSDSFFMIYKNGLTGLYSENGRKILPPQYKTLSVNHLEWIFAPDSAGFWAAFDFNGNMILDAKWSAIEPLSYYFLRVSMGEGWKVFARAGGRLSDESYTSLGLLTDDLVLLGNANGLGVMNKEGKVIISPAFEDINPEDNYYEIEKGGLEGLADSQGHVIVKPQYDQIESFDHNLALVAKDARWGLINAKGKLVVPAKYSRIDVYDGTAKARLGKQLEIYELDEQGELIDKTVFNNAVTITIGNRRGPQYNTANFSSSNVRFNSRNGGWYFDVARQKWGLKDTAGNIRIYPVFDAINRTRVNGLTLVSVNYPLNSYLRFGKNRISYSSLYGLVSEKEYRVVAPAQYLYIDMTNFFQAGCDYTRGMLRDGSFVLIKNGKASERYTYIDKFQNGYARYCLKGKFGGTSSAGKENIITSLQDFINETGGAIAQLPQRYRGEEAAADDYITCEKGQWGFFDREGNKAFADTFGLASSFQYGVSFVKAASGWGVMDTQGNMHIPAEYASVEFMPGAKGEYFIINSSQSRYSFIRPDGSLVNMDVYESAGDFHEERAWVKKGRMYQFVDPDGQIMGKNKYGQVRDFSEGLAAVRMGREWIYIDKSCSKAFNKTFTYASSFHQGLAVARKDHGAFGYINPEGEWVIKPVYSKAGDFDEWGHAIVRKGNRYLLIDKRGKHLLLASYKKINPGSEGVYVARKKNGFCLLDSSGKCLVNLDKMVNLQPYSNGVSRYSWAGMNGFVDKKGEAILPKFYYQAGNFSEGVATVGRNDKWGLIGISGDTLVPAGYKFKGDMKEEFIIALDDTCCYFMNSKGENAFHRTFQDALPFENGLAKARENGKWGMINKEGMWVISPRYEDISSLSENRIKVRLKSYSGVCDQDGRMILLPEYEYIRLATDGIFRVEKGSRIGYLDTSGKWLWDVQE